ncbi:hypothetical protein [Nostoc sp.]
MTYSRISHKLCDGYARRRYRTFHNPYPEYVSGIFGSLFVDAV